MKKILVAEDDKFLSNAYKLKLVKAGYEVRVALDGQEAITALGEFTPDLILLDLIMPVKDGFATLEEIKAKPEWKDIPVIIASNLGQQEDIQKGTGLGAADFIIKSDLSMEKLIEKIESFLGSNAAPASDKAAPAKATPAPVETPKPKAA
jgi:DNA-binding response OmpR family regulator